MGEKYRIIPPNTKWWKRMVECYIRNSLGRECQLKRNRLELVNYLKNGQELIEIGSFSYPQVN